jgi:hypothetical protein
MATIRPTTIVEPGALPVCGVLDAGAKKLTTSTSTASTAMPDTKIVRVRAVTSDCHIRFGASGVVATTSEGGFSDFLAAGESCEYLIKAGETHVAAIASAAGVLYVIGIN